MKTAHLEPEAALLMAELARETSELLADHAWAIGRHGEPPDPANAAEQLKRSVRLVARLASFYSISLAEAAQKPLERRQNLTFQADQPVELFDEPYPEQEQIPRLMEVNITTAPDGRAHTTINGNPFGEPLSDNRYDEDGYKYHDVFHIAHAAILGWSPTLRGILHRKRKSNPAVDEVEDGGRAIVIEEGIVALVFSHAEQHNFLLNHTEVDRKLLRTLKNMTAHLEVSQRTEGDWQEAILTGYRVWNLIRQQKGGNLTADLRKRTVTA